MRTSEKRASNTKEWVIYRIISPTGKNYVGKSYNLNSRLSVYRSLGCKAQPLLYNSLKSHGFDSHYVEIVERFTGENKISNEKEKFWIEFFMSNNNRWKHIEGYRGGLNLTDGGEGMAGYRYSDETKFKMSLAKKGKPSKLIGYKQSLDVCLRKSEALKGRTSPTKGIPRYNALQKEEIRLKTIEKNGRKVFIYTMEGHLIKEYPAITVAAKDLGISANTIHEKIKSKYCLPIQNIIIRGGELQTIESVLTEVREKLKTGKSKEVFCFKDDELIYTYPSVMDTAKGLCVSVGLVSKVLSGVRKKAKGFTLKNKI